jgi:hypothetical protein
MLRFLPAASIPKEKISSGPIPAQTLGRALNLVKTTVDVASFMTGVRMQGH